MFFQKAIALKCRQLVKREVSFRRRKEKEKVFATRILAGKMITDADLLLFPMNNAMYRERKE